MIKHLKLAADILRAKRSRSFRPFKLTFAVTYRCNMKCTYCNVWKKSSFEELSISEIDAFFRRNRFPWIDVTGGEIFMRDDILEVFKVILKRNRNLLLLNFPTNGFLTGRIVETARFIRRNYSGRLYVSVSLDGPRSLHDRLRGTPRSFERCVRTFRALKKVPGLNVHFGFTINDTNFNLLFDTIRAVQQELPAVTARDFHINLVNNSEHFYNVSTNIIDRRFINTVLAFKQRFGYRLNLFNLHEQYYMSRMVPYIKSGRFPMRTCYAMRSSLFLDPRGDVYPCAAYSKRITNLRDIGFLLSNLAAYRGNILNECPHCWNACDAYPSMFTAMLP